MAKAWKIPYLNPRQNLEVCLRKVLRTRFNEMISNEGGTIEGKDIEALHDMRVSSRRIQAVMKVFRAAFPPKAYKKEYARIKTIKDVLGEVRHLDVFIEMLESLRDKFPEKDLRTTELLTARQKMLRAQKRNFLVSHLNYLNKLGIRRALADLLQNLCDNVIIWHGHTL